MADEPKVLFNVRDLYGDKAEGATSPPPAETVPAEGPAAADEGYRPGFEAPKKLFSLNEAYGVKPESERGPLDKAPGETYGSALVKGGATAGIRGLAEAPVSPGMYGSLRELVNLGAAYVESKFTGEPLPDVMTRFKQREEEAYSSPIGQITKKIRVPSGEELAEKAYERTGKYEAESEAGKIGQAFTTGLVSGVSPSGKTGLVKQTGEVLGRAGLIGTGSAAADVTARYTGSVPLALAAGALTPTALSSLPAIARAHLAPKSVGRDVVGQIGREAAEDPQKVIANLRQQEKLVPGVTPTTAQKAQDEGMANLEQRLAGENRLKPQGSQERTVEKLEEANVEAIQKATEKAGNRFKTDVMASYNLTGSAPREMASEQARSIFSALEKNADDNVKKLWKAPELESATMRKDQSIDPVIDYINKLSPTERNAIPDVMFKTVNEIKDLQGNSIPLGYMQKLRSDFLAKGRKGYADQDSTVGAVNYLIAEELRKVISNSKNIDFGGMRGGKSVPQSWEQAVKATKEYHDDFNRGFLKSLNREVEAGVDKIPAASTFRALMRDKTQAPQSLAELQSSTKGAINPMFSDYMVAELTNNGTKLVKPTDVNKFIGQNAKLIDQTPGLRDRLTSIRDASRRDLFSASLLKNMDSPEDLTQFLQQNRSEIASITKGSPQDRAYLRLLETSANRIKALPTQTAVPVKTLDRLAEGRVSDILYGVATGRIAAAAAGAGLVSAATNSTLYNILGAIVGAGARSNVGPVNTIVDALLTGKVRENALEILHDARSNPALMAKLMERPDPQIFKDLFSFYNTRATTPTAVESLTDQNDRRKTRASGGRVSRDIEAAADALIRAAESTKKALGRETETLLNHDDNTIAHALEVANKAI